MNLLYTWDTYADSTLPFPDAKVCAALCKGGPVHYKVRENSGITYPENPYRFHHLHSTINQ